MNLYQLIYARCDKAFKIDKNGKEKFVIANAGSAGYGWFGVSKQMIDKMLNVAADIDNLFLSGFAKDFSDSRSQFVRSSFAYTKVSYEDRIIPIWAYIYIQNIPNSNRSFTGRHFLVGDKSDTDITPCRMINAEAWKDFQKKDSHSNRDDLSVKDTEEIKNSLRGEPTRESSIEDNDYFKNNQKRRELLKKALCFAMEQISLIDYENHPEQAKTLIIREAQKDMVFWIEAITYLLTLVNGEERDYVSKLTFITNVSDIRDNSDKVLFYNKRLPYFIIAGAYPVDKTVNFGNDGARYRFMDPETGSFQYYDSNNPFNPNNNFFKDILENPEQVMKFSKNSKSQSPKDFLLEYDLQAKEKFIAKNINNKKEIDYKYIWDFFSEFDNFYNEKREKQALGMTDIIDEIIKNRYDLFVEDYEHDFNLSSLICEKFPEKQKDILIRKLKVCLDKYRNLGIQANREPLKILEKILEKILDKFKEIAKKQKRILDPKSEKILSIVRDFAKDAEEKLFYTLKNFHKDNIKERIKEKKEHLNKDNNDNNAENNTAEYTEKSLTGSPFSEVEEDNGISYDQPISENSVKEKEGFFHNLWQYIKSLFGKKQESKSTRHGKKQTRRYHIMKNDIEKKAEDLSKEARLEAFREVLKEEYGEKYEIRVKKAETFIFKKNFSVACILLIAFVAIIAAYWPMRSLYNQKTLIPAMETKYPQSDSPKNNIEPKILICKKKCLPCPTQQEKHDERRQSKDKTGQGSQPSQSKVEQNQTSNEPNNQPGSLSTSSNNTPEQPSDTNL